VHAAAWLTTGRCYSRSILDDNGQAKAVTRLRAVDASLPSWHDAREVYSGQGAIPVSGGRQSINGVASFRSQSIARSSEGLMRRAMFRSDLAHVASQRSGRPPR
jgi:hypothetical protein